MFRDNEGGSEPAYHELVRHYEDCLARHGDSHCGVDWPNADDAARRYRVMLDVVRHRDAGTIPELIDVGCGAGHLLQHARREGPEIRYVGVDLSPAFVALCRGKFPDQTFLHRDVLLAPAGNPRGDFVVANGLFTEKRSLSWDTMWDFARRMIHTLHGMARHGLAFNVMSDHVDWRREDLFHLPYDTVAAFLRAEVSRHFVLRSDYGLHEYTAYVFHKEV